MLSTYILFHTGLWTILFLCFLQIFRAFGTYPNLFQPLIRIIIYQLSIINYQLKLYLQLLANHFFGVKATLFMEVIKSVSIFVLAGLCEIGGGYLVWQWVKEGKSIWIGILGGIILAVYGVVATMQTSNFAKVYSTYGGFFIVLSLLWAYKVDNYTPTKYDIIGALIALFGVCIIYYSPRN